MCQEDMLIGSVSEMCKAMEKLDSPAATTLIRFFVLLHAFHYHEQQQKNQSVTENNSISLRNQTFQPQHEIKNTWSIK